MANSNGWGDGAANNAIGWGQGANNAIGWGDIHADSWAGLTDIVGITTDPDAQAFITAAAITDPTQQAAINTLVVDLKGYGIWTKSKALYPFVGGTASQHKFNLKDPRDLDAAFRLVFSGGWTHSSTGALPNGTNAFADTKLIPNSAFANTNTHLSVYSRTATALTGYECEIGAYYNSGGGLVGIQLLAAYRQGDLKTTGYLANDDPDRISYNQTNGAGFFNVTRTATNSLKLFEDGVLKQTNSTAAGSIYNNNSQISLTLAALNYYYPGDIKKASYSGKQQAFASIGDGLTDTEAANFYTAVQAFQTTLGRQV